jgi:hypothetical protein
MQRLHTTLIKLILALLLLAATLPCQTLLLKLRTEASPYRPEELQDAPPGVAFTTVALGSARGIVADLLWLRSFNMQADGRYFELMQLARWITVLAGSEPQTWIQQAWNLSYNIPPILAAPEEKWHWVHSGIDLLRGDGVRNAGGPKLYSELAFIHNDKLGGQTDEFSTFYAHHFAAAITPLLDPHGALPPADDPRATELAETFGLLTSIANQLQTHYACTLDWRNPVAHAAYWAYRGTLASPPNNPSKRCDRILYQALSSLYRKGRSLPTPPQQAALEPTLFPAAAKAYAAAVAAHPTDTIMPAVNAIFLRQATIQLHRSGHEELAQTAFSELAQRYPDPLTQAGYQTFLATYKDPE